MGVVMVQFEIHRGSNRAWPVGNCPHAQRSQEDILGSPIGSLPRQEAATEEESPACQPSRCADRQGSYPTLSIWTTSFLYCANSSRWVSVGNGASERLKPRPFKAMDETDYFCSGIALAFRRREEDQHRQFLSDVVEAMFNFGGDEEHAAS